MSQLRTRHLTTTLRRQEANLENDPDSSAPPSRASINTTLRHADQTQLRETLALTHSLITSLQSAKLHTTSIPTSIKTLPGIPPYKLGYLPSQILTPFSTAADKAIKDAELLLEHMRDLQFQPYKGEGDNDIVKFEKEVAAMRDSEKEERLAQARRDVEAQLSRPSIAAQSLLEDVNKVRERGGIRVVKMANPFGSGKSLVKEDEVEEVDVEDVELEGGVEDAEVEVATQEQKVVERKARAEKRATAEKVVTVPPVGSILSLQQRLQASINAGTK